jgi:hypothetical protein
MTATSEMLGFVLRNGVPALALIAESVPLSARADFDATLLMVARELEKRSMPGVAMQVMKLRSK